MILLLLLLPIINDSLDNGFDYYLWPEHKLPMVEIRMVIEVGSAYDPDSLPGLANLTHQMLERGVKGYSYFALRDKIESMGAKVSLDVDREHVTISARCLSKHLLDIVEIISQLILGPTFPEDELAKLKNELAGKIRSRRDDPFAVGYDEFYNLVYKNQPLGHPRLGSEEAIHKITRKNLLKFYHTHYTPNASAIIFCGDFDSGATISKLKEKFMTWERGELWELHKPEKFDSMRIKVVNKNLSQAYIFYGNIGMPRSDPRFLAARLGNFALGGSGLTSRLSTKIREEGGLAYIAFSRVYSGVIDHPFISMVQTKIDSAPSSVRLLINEIDRIKMQGINEQEFKRAKSFYLGYFPIAFDTYRERADLMISIHRFGLGLDYLDRLPKMIRSTTFDEINEALQNVLNNGFGLVVVGPLDSFDLRSWLSDQKEKK